MIVTYSRTSFKTKSAWRISWVHRVLGEAWLESGELRAWLTQERAWLEGLQRRLRRSPNAPADAEEISDELYVSTAHGHSTTPPADPLYLTCRAYCCRTWRTTSRTTATSGWRASRTSGASWSTRKSCRTGSKPRSIPSPTPGTRSGLRYYYYSHYFFLYECTYKLHV